MKLFTNDKTQRLPYRYYYLPAFFLTIVGLFITGYLLLLHYKNYTDWNYSSFCAISNAINCDTVSQSPWSIFWGLPVAVWGMLGYLLFGLLLVSARHEEETMVLWSVLLLLSFVFSLVAVYLGYISSVRIRSYCIICILTYFVSFSLFIYSLIIWRRFGSWPYFIALKNSGSVIAHSSLLRYGTLTIFSATIILPISIPRYWELTNKNEINLSLPQGYTEDGHPWIGANTPEVIIEEFSDYQCFQCYKLHFALRKFIENAPDKIRLVHRNYPLDHEFNPVIATDPFHVGSGRLALLAIAAGKQRKFWEANDLIYGAIRNKQDSFEFEKVAQQLNLDLATLQKDFVSPPSLHILQSDIRAGLKYKITGTPAFVINGDVYQGSLPAFIFDDI